jgi:hypothetical protein
MKPSNASINRCESDKESGIFRRFGPLAGLFAFGVVVVVAATVVPAFGRQPAIPQGSPSASMPNVKCVVGLENIKPNSRGTLSLLPTGLAFVSGKNKVDISTSSIQDIFTGQESRQDVSGPGGTLIKAGIPYGGGRIVSLFSHGVEVLTVEYLDSGGGFHGTVFVLGAGKATSLKNQLVAQGAKVSTHVELPDAKEKP